LLLFPRLGRRQQTESVRKLVTHPHRYLVYYVVDEVAGDIVILSINHPARRRPHSDA
jgi:toxin ParE1/3/4